MGADNLVLRTVFVDPDVDEHLRARAACLKVSKAELFRGYLAAGMRAARMQPDMLSESDASEPLVLRTVCLDARLDHRLRVEAFDSHMSKNDLVRRYVRLGMRLQVTP